MKSAVSLCAASPGFGLGLRTVHYPDFQRQRQPLDWLEVITDNFLVEGGRPLKMLDFIRRDYPVAMHGVAMSLGSANGLDLAYLQKVKQLAERIQPVWVSDHLCWSAVGNTLLHDLNPLPYTDEAARRLIDHIAQAQDVLQRRLVIENVSSYVSFAQSAASEWEFLSHVAKQADCLLLVDINNIYVSSVNHGFDPLLYVQALPAHRVQQIHLAGHTTYPTHVIDTHDHPVCNEVWDLYAAACQRFGAVATMIERDDHIPPLSELLAELEVAKGIAQTQTHTLSVMPSDPCVFAPPSMGHLPLQQLQSVWADCVLQDPPPADASRRLSLGNSPSDTPGERFAIYHRAYRLRLCEVLRESFPKTLAYMGDTLFDQHAVQFVVQQPPSERQLGCYGAALPAFFQSAYPDNPELTELAHLDWDLRSRFDIADALALGLEALLPNAGGEVVCLSQPQPLHPSVVLRPCASNVVKIWRAIDTDEDVPEVQHATDGGGLVVWRRDFQPHFMHVDAAQLRFLQVLAAGLSIQDAAQTFADTEVLPTPAVLGAWLQSWLSQGLLHATPSKQFSEACNA